MNDDVLIPSEMMEVQNVMISAYEHVMANILGDTAQDTILTFVANTVLKEKPYMLVTTEGFQRMISQVFGNENHRDFVFTLTFAFLGRWGSNTERYTALCNTLAAGATFSNTELSGIPEVIRSRMGNRESVQQLLLSNEWLAVVLLLQLFVRVAPQKAVQQ